MQQIDNTRKIDSLVERALAGRVVGAKPAGNAGMIDRAPRPHHRPTGSGSPCDILQRLAQTIQLMRLEHADAHLYRNGCDALVAQAIDGSKWSGLRPALTQIMCLVEQGDYHWALRELRTISQPEWHTC
jgi:Flagellar protein FlbT